MKAVYSAILVLVLFFPPAINADVEKGTIDISFKSGIGLMLNGNGDIGLQYADQKFIWQSRYSGLPSAYWDNGGRNLVGNITLGLVWHAGRYWGIGLSSEPLRSAYNYSCSAVLTDMENFQEIRNRISAIPVQVEFFHYLPLGLKGRLTLVSHAGLGYYFAGWERRTHLISKSEYYYYEGTASVPENVPLETCRENLDFHYQDNLNSGGIGIIGGIGLEMKVNSFISAGCEVTGRYVDLRNWRGSSILYGDQVIFTQTSDGAWDLVSDTAVNVKTDGDSWTILGDRRLQKETEFVLEGGLSGAIRRTRLNLNSLGLAFSLRMRI